MLASNVKSCNLFYKNEAPMKSMVKRDMEDERNQKGKQIFSFY